ncbi:MULTISPECIES: hypothetical protein [Aliarcobacter]|jgi:hypothetical protein|uniref:Uncharacterized protein n=7 Tax=Arcobacteraceae TaxID=2808963 RepID=A0AAU0P140_9BACT|nr:hypothetical protein [Aliarcobacter cryaerophilus]MBK6302541.1 hypothetical protein [Arcobacter sp.]NCB10258.1 hypothetical protein [Erysipelotrichia bacterium]OQA76544.1 MAG: hypothetical protein BWY33_00021 [Candidatus Dependentiae bacterium ADurb.Bin246]PRM92360.1 hypothetical protein CJ672_05665 [Arcobacter cryaerophilus gv. occultus]WNL13468.1 hypothetical protein RJG52_05255 [Arcobacter sp. AZ-2023]WPD02795.1 hypothetical protein QUR79_08570 [Arcobacter sp. DSM 115972]WPD04914.1 hyp
MTIEEEQIFIDKIKETLLPIVIYMKEEEIKKIILSVEEQNENLPEGFGDMLFEQLIILKYNRLGK